MREKGMTDMQYTIALVDAYFATKDVRHIEELKNAELNEIQSALRDCIMQCYEELEFEKFKKVASLLIMGAKGMSAGWNAIKDDCYRWLSYEDKPKQRKHEKNL
jgi:hypothetical protein